MAHVFQIGLEKNDKITYKILVVNGNHSYIKSKKIAMQKSTLKYHTFRVLEKESFHLGKALIIKK